MRILIVEDEIRLAEALGQIMEENKYTADIVHDGEAGLDYALSGIYDVIVLDVMLPKRNGFDIVRELRAQKDQTPVLLLTAKDEVQDKVTGLDCGADDYLTKPFFTEFEVIRLLLSNPKIILSKETLLLKIWGSESEAEDNNVEAYISFLRKKLAFLHSTVQIATARKLGYHLEENAHAE